MNTISGGSAHSKDVRFGPEVIQNSADICRICHCEWDAQNPLLTPCLCAGSLKYVHRTCLQQWLMASETNSCELCKFPFIMQSKIKPFNEWRSLEMSGIERRRLCCSLLFHGAAALCVIWSLCVLIERAADDVQRGLIGWPFWTKLVVVTIGLAGGLIFMYIQCKAYLHLCHRWKARNRVLFIQNAPDTIRRCSPISPNVQQCKNRDSNDSRTAAAASVAGYSGDICNGVGVGRCIGTNHSVFQALPHLDDGLEICSDSDQNQRQSISGPSNMDCMQLQVIFETHSPCDYSGHETTISDSNQQIDQTKESSSNGLRRNSVGGKGSSSLMSVHSDGVNDVVKNNVPTSNTEIHSIQGGDVLEKILIDNSRRYGDMRQLATTCELKNKKSNSVDIDYCLPLLPIRQMNSSAKSHQPAKALDTDQNDIASSQKINKAQLSFKSLPNLSNIEKL